MTEQEKLKQREQSISRLKQLGVIKCFDSMAHLYHGNYVEDKEGFYFDPSFESAVGTYRLNGGAGFYAAEDKKYIDKLMNRRIDEAMKINIPTKKGNYTVHEIIASNPNALVFTPEVGILGMTTVQTSEMQGAFKQFASTFDFTEVCPLSFDEYQQESTRQGIMDAAQLWLAGDDADISYLEDFDEHVDYFISEFGMDEETAIKYVAKFTVFGSFLKGDLNSVARALVYDKHWYYIKTDDPEREEKAFQYCVECAKEIMNATNIVGAVDVFYNKPNQSNYFFWSLDKVNTKSFIEKQKQKNRESYGSIAEQLENSVTDEDANLILLESSPQEVVEFLTQKVPELKTFYDMKDGNWEGFSIGQHTESVLRVFDDSFADEMSPEIVPFMKVVIAMHDVGKGKSRAEYERNSPEQKQAEKKYTADMINKMGTALGINPETCEFMRFIIQDSQRYTTDYYVRHDITALDKMNESCAVAYKNAFGREPSHADLVGIKSLATALQTCDSGAYSLKGISRDQETGIYHFNGNPDFGKDMEMPMDIAKRKMHFCDPKEQTEKVM